MAQCKISLEKSILFLHENNSRIEYVMKENIPFATVTKGNETPRHIFYQIDGNSSQEN